MYITIKSVIKTGDFELTDMMNKIDAMWVKNKISEEEKDNLIKMAQDKADCSKSINIMKKLKEIEDRLRELENKNSTSNSETPAPEKEEYPEYQTGHWYLTDDKVTFKNKKYICVAPSGQTCVWSPIEYPLYWEVVVK